MKTLIFALACFPVFLFSQNNLRLTIAMEHNTTNFFNTGSKTHVNYGQINRTPVSGIGTAISLEFEFKNNWSWLTGVNYSSQGLIMETGLNFSEICQLIDKQLPISVFLPTSALEPDTRHKIHFSTIGLFSGLQLTEQIGKIGVQTSVSIGLKYNSSFETNSTEIKDPSPFSTTLSPLDGDTQPNKLYGFGQISAGLFYSLSSKLRISGSPSFSLDFK